MGDIDTKAILTQKADLEVIRQEEVAQEAVEDNFRAAADRAMFNPLRIRSGFDTLANRVQKKGEEKKAEEAKEEEVISDVTAIDEISEQYEQRNPELHARTLLVLKTRISAHDSIEDILKKVQEAYPDHSLADEALDFLIETSHPDLAAKCREAKELFQKTYGREIAAGRNIATQSREFAEKDIGTPTALRDLYRNVIQNPKDPATRFAELTETYSFEKLKTVIAFILHSLGADLKSKGPSIAPGELSNLMTESKVMQAILGVYRFFKSRMPLVMHAYEREGYRLPARVTFESLSKLFVKLLADRYPSGDKILQIGAQLGLEDEYMAEAILFVQMRDATRYVSPRLFRSEQHRQDTLALFLEVLKQLEEKEEEEEEDE